MKKSENENELELVITFHPASLANIVEDMKAQGLSDEDIAIEVDKIKAQILEDYKEHEANGTLDEAFSDADEDDGEYSSNSRLH